MKMSVNLEVRKSKCITFVLAWFQIKFMCVHKIKYVTSVYLKFKFKKALYFDVIKEQQNMFKTSDLVSYLSLLVF